MARQGLTMKTPQNWRQWGRVGLALLCVTLLLALPVALIFRKALSGGVGMMLENLNDPDMRHAIKLTLLATGLTVPINLVFGIMLAWCVTRYEFRGRKLLMTLMDIPYATSPVVAGLCYITTYG